MDRFFTLEISEGHLRGGPDISCFINCLFKAVEWCLPHQLHFNDTKPHWILIVWKVNKNGKIGLTALTHYFPAVLNIANIGFSCVEVLPVATGKILIIALAKKWVQIHESYQHWQFASGSAQHNDFPLLSWSSFSQSGSQGNEKRKKQTSTVVSAVELWRDAHAFCLHSSWLPRIN